MCIIAAKPRGIDMPSKETIRRMWYGNPDGAGIMYSNGKSVVIHKGFMKLSDFEAELEKLSKTVDLKKAGVVMHFRITTHGGTKPENCHPFPVSQKLSRLRQTRLSTNIGVAHNGVISITPRDRTISDTMEYIASQLYPLSKICPDFYANEYAMLMIQNAITSRMAFLLPDGKIYTTGDFIEDGGMIYSNDSYKRERWSVYSHSDAWSWDEWDRKAITTPVKQTKTKTKDKGKNKSTKADTKKGKIVSAEDFKRKELMWLTNTDECAYVKTADGNLHDGWDFQIDSTGAVYQYDPVLDGSFELPGAQAFTSSDLPLRYDPDCATLELVFTSLPF